jgi:hypothetical protein
MQLLVTVDGAKLTSIDGAVFISRAYTACELAGKIQGWGIKQGIHARHPPLPTTICLTSASSWSMLAGLGLLRLVVVVEEVVLVTGEAEAEARPAEIRSLLALL